MKETPYQNARGTFLKARSSDIWNTVTEAPTISLVGVPFDGATSYRPGARFAPAAVCEASAMLTDGGHPSYGCDPSAFLEDCGDIIVGNDHRRSMEAIADWYVARKLHRQGIPVFTIGGDHSISAGILAGLGLVELLTDDTKILVLDGHSDTWIDDFGLPRGHGTWVRDVIDDGLIRPENIMQIGIRSPTDRATRDWLPRRGGIVFNARDAERNNANFMAEMRSFTQRSGPLYVSVDIDCLDPAFAPGTGTPEIGGLSSMRLLEILEAIDTSRLIGVDLVEVNPPYDPTKITALAGATILWTLMASFLNKG